MIHPKLKSYSMKAEDGAAARRAKSAGVLPERKRRAGAAARMLMRTWVVPVFLLIGAALGRAQNLSIDWWTVDGGGGTSTGGVYAVTGTIGQPDAGRTMTGGPFALTGGFWALLAVQTPGAPYLSVAYTTTNTVALFWPSPSPGWVLQQNTHSVASVNWSDVTVTPVADGTNQTVIVNPPTGNRFYRLYKP